MRNGSVPVCVKFFKRRFTFRPQYRLKRRNPDGLRRLHDTNTSLSRFVGNLHLSGHRFAGLVAWIIANFSFLPKIPAWSMTTPEKGEFYLTATHSISTRAFLGRQAAWNAAREGKGAVKNSA